MNRRVFLLLSLITLSCIITGCSNKTYIGKVIHRQEIEVNQCEFELVNRIADTLVSNYRNEIPFTNDLAIHFLGTDSCQCHYVGIVDISPTEKKILFLCDSISRIRNGAREFYGESYSIQYNYDSIINISKGIVHYPEEFRNDKAAANTR